jgi:hypothetical protein
MPDTGKGYALPSYSHTKLKESEKASDTKSLTSKSSKKGNSPKKNPKKSKMGY